MIRFVPRARLEYAHDRIERTPAFLCRQGPKALTPRLAVLRTITSCRIIRPLSLLTSVLLLCALPGFPAHADTIFTAPPYPSADCTPVAAGLSVGLAPQQWNAAAGLPLTPSGTPAAQRIVIAEFDQSANQAAVNLLLAQCGLPTITLTNHTNSNGVAGAPNSGLESTLDVTVAAAALPANATITLVDSPAAWAWYGLYVNVAEACGLTFAGDPWVLPLKTASPGPSFPAGGCIASISYGEPEPTPASVITADWVLDQLADNGVVVVVSAGDEGSGGCMSAARPPMNFGQASTVALSTIAITSNVATLTTTSPHGFTATQNVYLGGLGPDLDGIYRIQAVTATTFTVAMVHTNLASTSITGAMAAVNFGTLIPQYPASNPVVLAVGGTQWDPLTQSLVNGFLINYVPGSSVNNYVWWDSHANSNCANLPSYPSSGGEATGGGQSATYVKPNYQETNATANYPTLPARRMMPDIAGLAGWPGYAIANPGITVIGGGLSSNIATIYTPAAHGITTGELVTTSLLPAPFTALTVTDALVLSTTTTSVSFALTSADISPAYVASGNIGQSCNAPCSNTAFPWNPVVGTSAATPLTAIGIANVNAVLSARGLPRITNDGGSLDIHSIVYSSANSSAFRDVTTGSNDIHNLGGYTALTGFDMATGMGVPNFSTLADLLVARLSPSPGGGGSTSAPQQTPTPTPTVTATSVVVTPVVPIPVAPVMSLPTVVNLGDGVRTANGSKSSLTSRVTTPEPATRSRAGAPALDMPLDKWRVPVLRVPGPAREFVTQMRIRGEWESLGKVTSTKAGKISLPALCVSKSGAYAIRVLDTQGRAYFISLRTT